MAQWKMVCGSGLQYLKPVREPNPFFLSLYPHGSNGLPNNRSSQSLLRTPSSPVPRSITTTDPGSSSCPRTMLEFLLVEGDPGNICL